jgi:hypothetical protein
MRPKANAAFNWPWFRLLIGSSRRAAFLSLVDRQLVSRDPMTRELPNWRHQAAVAVLALCAAWPPAQANTPQQLIQQLDALDREDFLEAVSKGRACVLQRNFACVEREYKKAGKLANTAADKRELATLDQMRARELAAVRAEEQRAREIAERERQLAREAEEAERRAQREAEAAERRAERARREAEAEEAEESRRANHAAVLAAIQGVGNSYANALQQRRDEQARTNQLVQQAYAQKQAQADKAAQERAELQRQRDEARREQQDRANRSAQLAADQRAQQRRDEEAAREAERRRQAEAERRAELERERQAEAARRAEAEAARKAEAERLAREKAAQKAAEEQAKVDYLRMLRSQIRIGARNCYGQTEVEARLPKVKEVVDCIDIEFTAYCPGSAVGTSGVLTNFVDMGTGCFGDTATIPKQACKPAEMRVVVDQVVACRPRNR